MLDDSLSFQTPRVGEKKRNDFGFFKKIFSSSPSSCFTTENQHDCSAPSLACLFKSSLGHYFTLHFFFLTFFSNF